MMGGNDDWCDYCSDELPEHARGCPISDIDEMRDAYRPPKYIFTVPGKPIGKPRMTQSDVWKEREVVLAYREYADKVRAAVCQCSVAEIKKLIEKDRAEKMRVDDENRVMVKMAMAKIKKPPIPRAKKTASEGEKLVIKGRAKQARLEIKAIRQEITKTLSLVPYPEKSHLQEKMDKHITAVPARIEIHAYFPMPLTKPARFPESCFPGGPRRTRPDTDNITKTVKDVLFKDDAMVFDDRCIKWWDDGAGARTIIMVWED